MERRYGALRFVSVLMKIIGVLSILAGFLGIAAQLRYLAHVPNAPPLAASIAWIAASILTGILWWAAAELISVIIDIEWNTRRMSLNVPTSITPPSAAAD